MRAGKTADEALAGECEVMRALRAELLRVAPLDTTVLLGGETGTGKGVAARLLHRESGRTGGFVEADCASLVPTLFESELFGHERGAFTGAVTSRAGRFERAADGTVFLDEVGELPATLQARLLRVLQDRRFERVGGSTPRPMRARILAATARDLPAEVRAGRFRADLYYRLAVVRLDLPPLRERSGDVLRLARRALPAVSLRLGLPEPRLQADAERRLALHPWWGNVRELLNVVERLAIGFPGRAVGAADVAVVLDLDAPRPRRADGDGARPDPTPGEIEAALRAAGGNVAGAARRLGVARTTLRRRLRKRDARLDDQPEPRSAIASTATSRSAMRVRTLR